MEACVSPACRRLLPEKWEASPVARQRLGRGAVTIRVRREFTRLNLKIEVRDAQLDPKHRRALRECGGKVQVPCLLIANPDGPDQWLYESRDIIAWLRQRFGT